MTNLSLLNILLFALLGAILAISDIRYYMWQFWAIELLVVSIALVSFLNCLRDE